MKQFLLLGAVLFAFSSADAQFFEDFNDGIPNDWTVLDESGGDVWQTWFSGWGGGDGLVIFTDANANEDYLITPQFLITAGISERISFHIRSQNSSHDFQVRLSTTGTTASDFTEVIADETAPFQEFSNYSRHEFDLSAYAGQNVYVAIVPTDTNGAIFYLDEFSNDSFNCESPYALEVSPILLTESIVSWRTFPGQQDWSVQYGLTGFTLGNGTVVQDDNNFAGLTISGLTPGQSYDYYVQSNCGGNNSQWVGPFTEVQPLEGEGVAFPIPIDISSDGCNMESTFSFDYDQGFPFFAFEGNTNAYIVFNCGPQAATTKIGYWTRFTSPPNGAIKITTTDPNDAFTIHSLNCNNNGVCFRDEEVFCYRNPNNTNPQTVLNLEPNTEYSLAIWRYGFQSNPQVSEICVEAIDCVIPVDLDTTVTSATEAQISWTPYDGTQSSWEYVVQEVGMGVPTGSGIATSSTSMTVTGTENVTYELYVRTDCGGGSFSDWAGPFEWLQSLIPDNNNCEDAEVLIEQTTGDCVYVASGNTLGATYSPENFDDCTFGEEDVWYTFVATSTYHEFEIIPTNPDFSDSDYTGMLYQNIADCSTEDDVEEIYCLYNDEDENNIFYDLVPGETYYLRISISRSSFEEGLDSSFDLCISVPPPPPTNNDCIDAIPIQIGMSYSGDTTWATNFEYNDIPFCSLFTDDDERAVWFSYTGNGVEEDITISMCERTFSERVGVFTGDCNNLTCLFGLNQSQFVPQPECTSGWNRERTFTSDGTSTYYILLIGSDDDEFGTFQLDITSSVLSVEDEVFSQLRLYPNPVNETLTISNPTQHLINKVEIFDINGRRIKTYSYKDAFASEELLLNDMTNGVYFVKVYSESSFTVKRIIKQ